MYVAAQLKLEINDDTFYDPVLLNKDVLRGEIALNPAQWWELMGTRMKEKLPTGLSKLAQDLMMLPASTSSMERCFSTMGSIMTETRNRIGVEKASRLCTIYRHLNFEKLKDKDALY